MKISPEHPTLREQRRSDASAHPALFQASANIGMALGGRECDHEEEMIPAAI